ncbi:transposase [Virgibacillus halodenitrificans]|nr:transposase [Virgibacillus halodenitrificans]MEC2158776.1 transposase [Virgibacillus halodenitrificans]
MSKLECSYFNNVTEKTCKMNDIFVKSLYESIVKENLQLYKNLYETTNVTSKTDEYWKNAIGFYESLTDENKDTLMRIIEQTMIDTISNMLGVIDGSSTLNDCPFELKLLLDSNDTEGELQDLFLELIEERDSNS